MCLAMEVDAVVLDIDGVLVDTSNSYDRAVTETVAHLYDETVGRDEIQLFKNAGGFNNDWLVTDAISLYVLATREGFDQSLTAFTDTIAERGGGLDAARSILKDCLPPEAITEIESAWDPASIRRTFQWLYLGPEAYASLEDEAPPEDKPATTGLMYDEPLLISDETRDWLVERYPIGILTGRPRGEAAIALERIGLEIPADRRVTMDDWDSGKPDPAGLISIASACEATTVAYAGDELDDVRTAVNADTTDDARGYVGCGVQTGGVTGTEGAARFESVGAAAVLADINELPGVLSGS